MTLLVRLRHGFADFSLDVTFEAPSRGVTALFGPSGAGKSSVLLAVAGLLEVAGAEILLDGEALHALPPERRRIGCVFQDGRLFPHLNVAANLRYGARRARGPASVGFDEIVELLDLGKLLARRPATLSGGERQRAAIGRALLSQPRLLLLDEPLAALDAARRDEILPYLSRLKQLADLPMLYVTHALDEVLRLADTLVLIEAGRVVASGALGEIAARADLPLALRPDAAGVLAGVVAAHDAARQLSTVSVGETLVLVPLLALPPGAPVRLRVPAREVILARAVPSAISVNNVLAATVLGLAEDAARHATLVELGLGAARLLARVTPDAARRLELRPGCAVFALIKSMAVESLEEGSSPF